MTSDVTNAPRQPEEWVLHPTLDGRSWYVEWGPIHAQLSEVLQADDREVMALLVAALEQEKGEVEPWNSTK